MIVLYLKIGKPIIFDYKTSDFALHYFNFIYNALFIVVRIYGFKNAL
jgi:hypothetical protein